MSFETTQTAGKRCLIVLGMHRSGTSCLTGMVEQCGVNLGEVFTHNPFNKKGNRESASIQALNNDVLAYNGAEWNAPKLASAWDASLQTQRSAILNSLATADEWWGFKDPRVVFTLPFWLEAIAEPKFIATFRHPHSVAMSLQNRDGTSLAVGYELWRLYNVQLLQWLTKFDVPLVNFDLPDAAYQKDVAQKLEDIGLPGAKSESFFDASLRHQAGINPADIVLPDSVAATYAQLKAYYDV